ncbi:hypothetical protein EV361DRAFT_379361 [Lentinula raphanica]|nr:hypothetical protein EV361DRAFT_379361 [Lentinula raphanica]
MNTKNASINLEDLSTCEENTQPIRSFRSFTGEFYCGITTLEYHWGLEKGEMDLWGPLNRIFVRADVAPLFLDWKLALVPTVEVLQKLSETVEHNFLMPTDQRRSCFEVRSLLVESVRQTNVFSFRCYHPGNTNTT